MTSAIVDIYNALSPDSQSILQNRGLAALHELAKKLKSFTPVLGPLIHIRGKPFTQGMFPQFAAIFTTALPSKTILKCGRQVGKSSSMAAKTIVLSSCISHFNTLVVTPLFEMTRRFSSNYVRPMIEHSPIAGAVLDYTCEKSVLQKTFKNRSMMHFSYAFLNADRVRGISSDYIFLDEIQDIDFDFLDEILQTASRSAWRLADFAGTAKTLDNGIQTLWDLSSMAEWIIPCTACKKLNNPFVEAEGLKMIGERSLICAFCGADLDSDMGDWQHQKKDLMLDFPGYHIPQFILKFHYKNERNWKIIREAKAGAMPKKKFYNEILGESFDIGAKLLTELDLKTAAILPFNNVLREAKKRVNEYLARVIGVDWGGRGEGTLSFTKIAILGLHPTNVVHLLYGENLSESPDPGIEVYRVMKLFDEFNCTFLAHDAGGTAGMRDTFMLHSNFPMERVLPCLYVTAWAKNIINFHELSEKSSRYYYSIDKTRSLFLTSECIKNKILLFPKFESCENLLRDFLALMEEQIETRRGGDIYLIRRNPTRSDDFAHAVNLALTALFHTQNKWPNLLKSVEKYRLSQEVEDELDPGKKLTYL